MKPTFPHFFTKLIDGKRKHYGLTYLKTTTRADFDSAFKLYDECYSLFDGASFSIKTHLGRINNARQILEKSSLPNEAWQTIKQDVHVFREDIAKRNAMTAYLKQSERLQDSTLWEKWYGNLEYAGHRLTLKELQEQWQRHGKFAHFPCEALFFADELLSEFATHQKLALRELQFSIWLPKEVRTQYKNYLNEWGNQIEQERESLQWAMAARLQSASESNLGDTNVIAGLKNKLAKLPLTVELAIIPPTTLYATSAAEVKKLYHHLHKQGIPDVKDQLKELKCLQPKQHFVLTAINTPQESFFVPQVVSQFIPSQPKWPGFLFKGHQQRFEYFRDKTGLLIQLNALPYLPIVAANLKQPFLDPTWQKLINLENELATTTKKKQIQYPTGVMKYFRKQTTAFINEWRSVLLEQQVIILNKELDFIEQWLPKLPLLETLLEEPIFTLDQTQDLQEMFTHVDRGIRELVNLSVDCINPPPVYFLQLKFLDAQKKIQKIITHDDNVFKMRAEYRAAREQLFDIINNDVECDDPFNGLATYHHNLSDNKKAYFKALHQSDFISLKRKIISKIQIAFCQVKTSKDMSINTITQNVIAAHQLLTEAGILMADPEWQATIESLVTNYRQFIEALPLEAMIDNNTKLNEFEGMLTQISSEANYLELKAASLYRIRKTSTHTIQTQAKENPISMAVHQPGYLVSTNELIQNTYTCIKEASTTINDIEPYYSINSELADIQNGVLVSKAKIMPAIHLDSTYSLFNRPMSYLPNNKQTIAGASINSSTAIAGDTLAEVEGILFQHKKNI